MFFFQFVDPESFGQDEQSIPNSMNDNHPVLGNGEQTKYLSNENSSEEKESEEDILFMKVEASEGNTNCKKNEKSPALTAGQINKDRLYHCNECGYAATKFSNLKRHNRSKHKGKRYPCNVCDYVARKKGNLKEHKESQHEGVRYPCKECGYAATSKRYLIAHIKIKHEGIRIPCSECNYSAGTAQHLKLHKENVHDKIRHPCSECNYSATTAGNLRIHEKQKHSVGI